MPSVVENPKDLLTFTSNGIISSQHRRWWTDVDPNFTVQTHDQYCFRKWCGIYKNKIIRLFFDGRVIGSLLGLHGP